MSYYMPMWKTIADPKMTSHLLPISMNFAQTTDNFSLEFGVLVRIGLKYTKVIPFLKPNSAELVK